MADRSAPIRKAPMRAPERLHSWKEIAAWFDRTERTVQRWEQQEQMPVHRLVHSKRSSIYAETRELEEWAARRRELLEAPEKPPAPRRGLTLAALAIAGCCLCAAALFWSARHFFPGEAAQPPLRAVRITAFPGSESHPALSPDGTRLAFSFTRTGASDADLSLLLLGVGQVQPLTRGGHHDLWAAWSPDGRWISFLRPGANREPASLIRLPAIGGEEKLLTRICPYPRQLPAPYYAWMPDSRSIILSDQAGTECAGPFQLQHLDLGTGARTLLTQSRQFLAHSAPAVSPDGRRLAFIRWMPPTYELVMAEIRKAEATGQLELGEVAAPVKLTNPISHPVWLPDSRTLLYQTFIPETYSLWRVAVEGSPQPRQVLIEGTFGGALSLSQRGDKLAFSHSETDYDLWRQDLRNPGSPPVRFASSTARDLHPSFSIRGDRVLFTSNRSGAYQIWVANQDGSEARQLTQVAEGWPLAPSWSPDGRRFAFQIQNGERYTIAVGSLDAGPTRHVETPGLDARGPHWSPDGKYLYFYARRDGPFGIYRVPADGGPVEPVNTDVASFPVFSPDGGSLYCMQGRPEGGIWRHHGGVAERLPLPRQSFDHLAVSSTSVYFTTPGQRAPATRLVRYDVGSRKLTTVLEVPEGIHGGFTVTADDSTLIYAARVNTGSDLWLVENFR
jgi:Tol biopolymer transport system component